MSFGFMGSDGMGWGFVRRICRIGKGMVEYSLVG